MRVGICGYPGSGKSTIFSALAPGAGSQRHGVVFGNIKVPDSRVDRLTEIFRPQKKIYAEITFVDVGGGGRVDTGAFPPEVVNNMRSVDVLAHVVRCFDNPTLAAPQQPERDEELFNDELSLIDLGILERRQDRWRRESRKGKEVEVNDRCVDQLEAGLPLRGLGLSGEEQATLSEVQLLSFKPLVLVYNLSEAAWSDPGQAERREMIVRGGNELSIGICGAAEAEVAQLSPEEQREFLDGLGLGEPARYEFIRAAYRLLDLIGFLTVGPDECRAWPIRAGTNAREAAGKVHSDIERGFIRAEVYRIDELEHAGSEAALRSAGKIRVEGKDYVVQDGDIVFYRFNI